MPVVVATPCAGEEGMIGWAVFRWIPKGLAHQIRQLQDPQHGADGFAASLNREVTERAADPPQK
jgi:hypothetical protein